MDHSLESCVLLFYSKFSTVFHKTERSVNFFGAYFGKGIPGYITWPFLEKSFISPSYSQYIFVPLRNAAEATADGGFSLSLLIFFALRRIVFVLKCITLLFCSTGIAVWLLLLDHQLGRQAVLWKFPTSLWEDIQNAFPNIMLRCQRPFSYMLFI